MPPGFFAMRTFTIHQHRAAMKVTQDACILGAWAPLGGASTVVDIGTGTGLLALMAAHRLPDARIDAVDVDEGAYADAADNVAASDYRQRITVHRADIRTWSIGREGHYDHILCNPPFFQNQPPSADPVKRTARHAETLSFDDLAEICRRLLAPAGKATILLPVTELEALTAAMTSHGLAGSGHLWIRDRDDLPQRRIVTVWTVRDGGMTEAPDDHLTVRSAPAVYTDAMKDLMRPYYLHV